MAQSARAAVASIASEAGRASRGWPGWPGKPRLASNEILSQRTGGYQAPEGLKPNAGPKPGRSAAHSNRPRQACRTERPGEPAPGPSRRTACGSPAPLALTSRGTSEGALGPPRQAPRTPAPPAAQRSRGGAPPPTKCNRKPIHQLPQKPGKAPHRRLPAACNAACIERGSLPPWSSPRQEKNHRERLAR